MWYKSRRFFYNLSDFFKYDLPEGIKNIYKWFPLIWKDRDYDWEFLANIMEFKLRNMSKRIGDNNLFVGADREAKRMLICAELLKRLKEDSCTNGSSYIIHENNIKYFQEYFGKLIGKHLRKWWD